MNKQVYLIIGRFVNDPEMKYTPTERPYTKFRFATSRYWKDASGERVEKTTFFNATAWAKLAEVINQYGAKGRLALVESDDIDASAYTNKAGEPACSLEITVRSLTFLDKNGHKEAAEPAVAKHDEDEGDLPF
jgi:single-strand DNA-binding protein